MLNRIILIGRLTADPELRYTPTGTAVASFTLAVDRPRPNAQGERETDFINVVVWQKLGELCAQYLRKGRLAAVEGRLQIRSYENKEGIKVRVAEVIADNVRFLERPDNNNQGGGNDQNGGNQGGYGNGNQGGYSNGSQGGYGNGNQGGYGNGGQGGYGQGGHGNGNQGGYGGGFGNENQGGGFGRNNQGGGYGGGGFSFQERTDNSPFTDDGKPIDISMDDLPF